MGKVQINGTMNLVNDAYTNRLKLLLSFKRSAMLKGSYSNHRFSKIKAKPKKRRKLINQIKLLNLVKDSNSNLNKIHNSKKKRKKKKEYHKSNIYI